MEWQKIEKLIYKIAHYYKSKYPQFDLHELINEGYLGYDISKSKINNEGRLDKILNKLPKVDTISKEVLLNDYLKLYGKTLTKFENHFKDDNLNIEEVKDFLTGNYKPAKESSIIYFWVNSYIGTFIKKNLNNEFCDDFNEKQIEVFYNEEQEDLTIEYNPIYNYIKKLPFDNIKIMTLYYGLNTNKPLSKNDISKQTGINIKKVNKIINDSIKTLQDMVYKEGLKIDNFKV